MIKDGKTVSNDVVDTSKVCSVCKQICNNAGGLVSHMLWKHDKRVDADGEQGSSKKVNEEQGGSQQLLLLVDDGNPKNVVTSWLDWLVERVIREQSKKDIDACKLPKKEEQITSLFTKISSHEDLIDLLSRQ